MNLKERIKLCIAIRNDILRGASISSDEDFRDWATTVAYRNYKDNLQLAKKPRLMRLPLTRTV
jgi:hypothetical protein